MLVRKVLNLLGSGTKPEVIHSVKLEFTFASNINKSSFFLKDCIVLIIFEQELLLLQQLLRCVIMLIEPILAVFSSSIEDIKVSGINGVYKDAHSLSMLESL